MTMRIVLGIATAFAFAAPAVQAQEMSHEELIQAQLEMAESLVAAEGYQPRQEHVVGSVELGETVTQSIRLGGGGNYVVIAVCDTDCSDVDVAVYDSERTLVGSDNDESDVAIAQVRTAAAGSFTAEVTMYSCTVSPCFFGLGVFEK